MEVAGVDFTSRPSRRKPITCLRGRIGDGLLSVAGVERWEAFTDFEAALAAPGPWVAGFDFPFGLSRRFVDGIGWPAAWADYVGVAASLGRAGFRTALDHYRAPRPPGDKEHLRRTDGPASSVSPQKLYGVPVGLMFFEGAPRLAASSVSIPGLRDGDRDRIAVEAYPGVAVRRLIGRRPYKNDTRAKQTQALADARRALVDAILAGETDPLFGFSVRLPGTLADDLVADPTGDLLDALFCAMQAAWAWSMRADGFGAPPNLEPDEGWIADPGLYAGGPAVTASPHPAAAR